MSGSKRYQTATVYLIDSDIPRAANATALLKSWGFKVESFGTADEFLVSASGTRPGCVVVEHPLRGLPGTELHRRLTARGERLPLVVLCESASVSIAVDYLSNGALALLEKPCEPATILATLEAAIDADLQRSEVDERYRELRRLDAALTSRERLVVEGIVSGRLNRVMAKQLEVSIRTVEAIRAKVYGKFRVDTAAELATKTTELRVLAELVYRPGDAPVGLAPAPVDEVAGSDAWSHPAAGCFQLSL